MQLLTSGTIDTGASVTVPVRGVSCNMISMIISFAILCYSPREGRELQPGMPDQFLKANACYSPREGRELQLQICRNIP